MGNLFLSFMIAISGAVGLVSMSKIFDLDIYTSRIFPLIPILYAIIYEVLERRRTGRGKPIPPAKAKEEMKAGVAAIFQNITASRIITDVGVGLAIKFAFEIVYTALFIHFTGQSFNELYGGFNIDTIGRFMRGDHPWLAGSEGLALLAVIAFIISFGSGLWIGYTTKANAVLEGVITGALVTLLTTMTNMLILYRKIEEMAVQAADYMGYVMHVGFVVVITLQVLFYGLWSGIAQRTKARRAVTAEERRSSKKAR